MTKGKRFEEGTAPAGRAAVQSIQRKRDARTTREATYSGPQPSNVEASFPPVHSFLKSKRKLPHLQSPGSVYFITLSANTGVEFTGEERDIILGACRYWEGKKLTLHAAVVMPDHVHLLMQPLKIQTVTNARATVPAAQRKRDARTTGETTDSSLQTCRTTVPVAQEKPGFYSLSEIMHSIKSYTAHEINKLRNRKGGVWLHESYDRIMRDYEEFEEKLRYISMNPVKAGIADEEGRYKWLYLPGDAVDER